MSDIVLHGYWRSSAAYRVRIALNLKGVGYTQVPHDLRTGAQRAEDYLAIAPHGLVPALQVGDTTLIESPAILEWIEARWPDPPLLPAGEDAKAVVRAMGALIGCDIHPLNNLRVLRSLKADLQATPEQIQSWSHRWIAEGFIALDRMIERHGGAYAYGDTPTLADCYLVPQLFNARRAGADLGPYPALVAAGDSASALPAFRAAQPEAQPDADA